ncbi:hypothetical protein M2E15_1654 [Bacillus mycoides]|nr:ABC transporter, permease component [Bacillus mycoides DSM 2048]KUH41563.1 hypothetical protein M2E15_1654 [Bacillus mycoides]OSY02967.1 hypothetical protein BTJ44_05484 [Bacillus mycoides]OSY17402.1 hypothetical protein BTJ48_01213 [Bacillus mycoides]
MYARFFLANILERLGSMIAGISLMFYLSDQYDVATGINPNGK